MLNEILKMPRPGGNPDFGTKYKFYYGREKPLTAKITTQVYPAVKEKLAKLAKERNCSVPDVVRTALDEYLENVEEKNIA